MQIPRWLTWVPITPIVFYAADRFPFRRDRLARSVWTHFGIALLIAVVIEVLWLQISFVIQSYLEPEALARMQSNRAEVYSVAVLSRLLGDAFIYAAVLGVATTLGYHRRFRERELRTAQLEAQLALAQVQALKMQVHPHFLFNTLHAVTVLIREDPACGDSRRHTTWRSASPHAVARHDCSGELPTRARDPHAVSRDRANAVPRPARDHVRRPTRHARRTRSGSHPAAAGGERHPPWREP